MIELKNFTKIYNSQEGREIPAVENVSFFCEPGKVTGLVGENGSGKSTLIKAVTGIHYATEGTVTVSDREGKSFDVLEHPEEIKKITGYVPEVPVLPSDMKVFELLSYAFSLFYPEITVNSEKAKEKIKAVSEKCSITDVLEKKIKTLSKGYKQRVSFALALISNPSVLVLDEPFSGLDPAQIIQMRRLILTEAFDKTVLISTHNLSEVHNLCDQILVMKNGHLVASGTEESLKNQTKSGTFEEAFLKL